MKKKLIALFLMLMMIVPAALAEQPAEPTYYYPTEHLNTYLFIAPSWEELIIDEYLVFPHETHVTDDSGNIIAGSCIFYYKEDSYSTDGNTITQIAPNITDAFLAGIVMYPAGGVPEDAGLEGYSYREAYAGETFSIAAAWRDLDDIALPEGANATALEALIASFRDTDAYITVVEPVDSLGHFHTTDLEGNAVTSHTLFEESDAKLTLVNVWATYCQPCLQEMPYLGELAAEYADKGVQIVGIPIDVFDSAGNVDSDQIELAKRYVASTGADYLHLIPDGEMQSNLLREVYYVPNSWFLDSEGKLIGEAVVGSYSKEDWAGLIEEHLALVQD